VTMGHGVSHDETFCERLEAMVGRQRGEGASCQVINAGVQGYATWQELNMLRRLLVLRPDMVIVGFCPNDVTEPLVSDRALGGTGVGYQGFPVTANRAVGYFWSDTGYGRLAQRVMSRKQNVAAAKREEVFSVARLSQAGKDDPVFGPAWDKTLADLKEINHLARTHGITAILVVLPYRFQVLDRERRRPQAILAEHAEESGIEILDLSEVFERAVRASPNAEEALNRLFLDENHLSPDGHSLVASALFDHMESWRVHGEGGDGKGPL
jgi:lysophospholipase L1-like esterase